jgi:hemolysin III
VLVVLAAQKGDPWRVATFAVYGATLVLLYLVSTLYHSLRGRAKAVFRKLDHCSIYLLIAGTYTPFLVNIQDPFASWALIVIVWGGALIGMAAKLFLPGRFDGLAVAFYLGIGWSGVVMVRSLADVLPESTIWLIAAGGIAYSSGVIFFVWRSLRFQSALWHGFVVAGATFHLAAMTDFMVVTRL